MLTVAERLRTPAAISTLLLIPFLLLEVVNRSAFHEPFPVPLFATLWLLSLSFVLALISTLRTVQAGNRTLNASLGIFARVAFLVLIACFWLAIVIDQMPCFLGVPLCD